MPTIARFFATPLLGMALPLLTGCLLWGPIRIHNHPLKNPQPLVEITAQGSVVVEGGTLYRLAGIRMRSDEETGETRPLPLIQRIIGHQVEIEIIEGSDAAIVHFQKEIWYYCGTPFVIPHPLTIIHFLDRYQKARLNELLITTGLARFDPEVGPLPQPWQDSFRKLQEAYDKTATLRHPQNEKSLTYYVDHPEQICGGPGGLNIRIAPADMVRSMTGEGSKKLSHEPTSE